MTKPKPHQHFKVVRERREPEPVARESWWLTAPQAGFTKLAESKQPGKREFVLADLTTDA